MPVVFIEGLPGLRSDAKKKMIEKITAAVGQLQSENPKILEAIKRVQG